MSRITPAILLALAAAVCGAQTAQDQDLASLAGTVLAQTALARDAARTHNQRSALDLVHQAQASAAEIRSRAGNQGEPLLVAVRKTTETTTSYTDVKRKGSVMTAERMKRNTHVSDVEQHTVADELNVTTAQSNLDAAQAAIQRQDWRAADTALAAVQNLVHTTTSDSNLPLLQARQNLLLARARLVEGKPEAAVLPLRKAENALSDFEQQDRGPMGQQAEDMRQNIEAMARHIKTDASLDKIDDWLHTVQDWQATSKVRFQPPEPLLR